MKGNPNESYRYANMARENTRFTFSKFPRNISFCQELSPDPHFALPKDAFRTTSLVPGFQDPDLIFEGISEGKGEVRIIITDKNDKQLADMPGPWIEICDIKKMYRYVEVTGDDIAPPYRHMEGSPPMHEIPPEPSLSFKEVGKYNREQQESFTRTDDELVLVHGWRMAPYETWDFGGSMFKRLWHAGYKGHYTVFAWPCYYDVVPYSGFVTFNDSEYRAWKCAKVLKSFVGTLGGKRHIIAHSQGNIVAGEAIRTGMTLDSYTLMQAAVPGNCYGNVATHAPFITAEAKTRTPENIDDKGYGYAFSEEIDENVGRVLNCFNPDDAALVTAGGGALSWEANQRTFKPQRDVLVSTRVYVYKDVGSGEKSYLQYEYGTLSGGLDVTVHTGYRDATMHESMPFISRARAQAIGANNLGLPFDAIDLKAKYKFTNHKDDHSRQFWRKPNCTLSKDNLFGLYKEIVTHIYEEK